MLRSLYISASGMLTQRRTMDVLTNNLANLDTIGFKRDNLVSQSFSDVLIARINDPTGNSPGIGPLNWGIHVDEVVTRFEQGPLEYTGKSGDIALSGDGFFVVETPQGLRFTRSGNFQTDANGYLCTQEGYFVRSAAGRIQVGNAGFSVDGQGNVLSAVGASKLQIVQFADNAALRKIGENLYSGPATAQNSTATVMQGYLEGSNADMAEEMTNVIAVSRNYQTNMQMISMLNESLRKTVNEVGRL
jgi:flagellar basal-body rod protein FlgF